MKAGLLCFACAILLMGCDQHGPAARSPDSQRCSHLSVKKYDIIPDYRKFECEPGLSIPVDLVSTGQNDLDEKNVRIVEGKWKSIWPAALALLKKMRKEYDFDTNFAPASLRAKLMLADTVMAEDADWEVSFTIAEDGHSEWGVSFHGSEIDPDSSQPYF